MIDRFIVEFDKALRTVFAQAPTARQLPGNELPDGVVGESERRQTAALMRVNHSGEVCAQALYQGQALTCRDTDKRKALERAAWEETEHLNWTESRIAELGGRKSLLNPFWYAGSLVVGLGAGMIGDDWNLGFLAETEKQVGRHLEGHLARLSPSDGRSRSILGQMRVDELAHARTAESLGARALPAVVRGGMTLMARVMTSVAYRL